ncbi:uncharacterized protein JCM6883_000319 [Sporobolomyces salmoneus]|uniref:uncharacterized protein n=1 Tax=Sporobolomyces salmoneus TaxID=183962 RepID=UPI0031736CE4
MPFWSTPPRNSDEEAASLTRNASPWSRKETPLTPSDDDSDNASISEKAHQPSWRYLAGDMRRWRGGKAITGATLVALALIVLFGLQRGYFSTSTTRGSHGKDEGRPWKTWGDSSVVELGVNQGELPVCERTMLVDWRSFGYGFGSTATTVLQAGIVAHMHGYKLLFDRGANKYGRYLDFFAPMPLPNCRIPEELYDPDYYRTHKESGVSDNVGNVINDNFDRPTVNRLLVGTDDIHPLNHHITALIYPKMSYLDSLPPLDASKPVPVSSNVPRVFSDIFDQYSALSAEHFRFNPLMEAKVNTELARLGLDKGESEKGVATIGVHWRGGDKLERECVGSSQLSCGNVTHHCVTAWDSLPSSTSSLTTKPRLLLMTTEPNALSLFASDPICQRFSLELLEHSSEGEGEKQSFVQDEWNHQSDLQRLQDAQSMLVGSEILSNHVDAAVVSPNSNLARIIMTRAGPRRVKEEGKLRSVDIYWHPVHYPPFKRTKDWGGCDGTWGGCWPHD